MALIKCLECNKDVSDRAISCPNCGNPISKGEPTVASLPPNNEELLKCPRCNSTQLTSKKKGFSSRKAITGAILIGGIGLLAGTIGSGNIDISCLKCGYKYRAGEYHKEVEKLNKPSDSEIINKNPLQFIIIFTSLLSAVFIPLFFGGSWWFLLIMPIVGLLLLILTESLKGKPSATDLSFKSDIDIEIDSQIKVYIKQGQILKAAIFYKEKKGVSLLEAKNYVDNIASNL